MSIKFILIYEYILKYEYIKLLKRPLFKSLDTPGFQTKHQFYCRYKFKRSNTKNAPGDIWFLKYSF